MPIKCQIENALYTGPTNCMWDMSAVEQAIYLRVDSVFPGMHVTAHDIHVT